MTTMMVGNSREYGAAKPQCLESLRNIDGTGEQRAISASGGLIYMTIPCRNTW
jgi:hypothetical protein